MNPVADQGLKHPILDDQWGIMVGIPLLKLAGSAPLYPLLYPQYCPLFLIATSLTAMCDLSTESRCLYCYAMLGYIIRIETARPLGALLVFFNEPRIAITLFVLNWCFFLLSSDSVSKHPFSITLIFRLVIFFENVHQFKSLYRNLPGNTSDNY